MDRRNRRAGQRLTRPIKNAARSAAKDRAAQPGKAQIVKLSPMENMEYRLINAYYSEMGSDERITEKASKELGPKGRRSLIAKLQKLANA